jgi:hypothetical protein
MTLAARRLIASALEHIDHLQRFSTVTKAALVEDRDRRYIVLFGIALVVQTLDR